MSDAFSFGTKIKEDIKLSNNSSLPIITQEELVIDKEELESIINRLLDKGEVLYKDLSLVRIGEFLEIRQSVHRGKSLLELPNMLLIDDSHPVDSYTRDMIIREYKNRWMLSIILECFGYNRAIANKIDNDILSLCCIDTTNLEYCQYILDNILNIK